MIPIHLKLSGFLSYRDPTELDFTGFDLACISGANGAGKSSLLDAFTWALFGQARKRDDSLINLQAKAAEVAFTFGYEENIYRVIRSLPRGKTTLLEFQILQDGGGRSVERGGSLLSPPYPLHEWRPLTERTLRETQARIEQTLRLDYDTFVNAAFFLQGKADQFAQQSASKRKDILGSILGLEIWEEYKNRTSERRKSLERDLDSADGRIAEIDAELGEEEPRKARLAELEKQLQHMGKIRKTQEAALENVKKVAASLEQQRKLVTTLAAGLERAQESLAGSENRLQEIQARRDENAGLNARAREIEADYQAWQSARAELEKWEKTAGQFREYEKQRQPFLEEITAEKARLEGEQRRLEEQKKVISDQSPVTSGLKAELDVAKNVLEEIERKLGLRAKVEKQTTDVREKQAELRAENERLKAEMDELKVRIDKLEATEGALCPLCGQPLEAGERAALIERLQAEGKHKGNAWRANKTTLEELARQIANGELCLAEFIAFEKQRLQSSQTVAQLTERLEGMQRLDSEWDAAGSKRLKEATFNLQHSTFAAIARKRLAKVDKELVTLGYDTAAHESARRAESAGRAAEADYRNLESARAALKPLDDEIANLRSIISQQQATISQQQSEYDTAAASLAAAESQAPDLESTERTLFDLQEQENRLNQEVGGARQKVSVLTDLRTRKSRLESEREGLGLQIGRHKSLERAFGKDGVPALLIEQALPEIESKANELLDRLSDGTMSVRFVTQAAYKDKNREDLKETLDIQISDGAGGRDYEMYSGGEAFRVNFAIRLALSEVLARRKGARLQTLVIDEGFGSQDAQGRQRLIESINAVRGDFAKILVITHLDELKDAFPTRIEVEKTEHGSKVSIV